MVAVTTGALSADDVLTAFHRVRPLVETEEPHTTTPEGLGLDIDAISERVCSSCMEDMRYLLSTTPHLRALGYGDWVLAPELYRFPNELVMQRDLLVVLSEVRSDHPSFDGQGPVAIRWVLNPFFVSTCIPGERVSFVCLSMGFVKFLQVVVGTLVRLHEVARELPAEDSVFTNYLFGADAARAIGAGGARIENMINVLLGSAGRMAEGELTGLDAPLTPKLVQEITPSHPFLGTAYSSCETFIVLHELAHLFRRHEPGASRTLSLEIEADMAALSMLVIADARLDYFGPLFVGPAFFFQVARIYELATRTFGALKALRERMRQPEASQRTLADKSDPRGREQELEARLHAAILWIPRMGVPLGGLAGAMAEELDVLLAGCRLRLLTGLGRTQTLASLLPDGREAARWRVESDEHRHFGEQIGHFSETSWRRG